MHIVTPVRVYTEKNAKLHIVTPMRVYTGSHQQLHIVAPVRVYTENNQKLHIVTPMRVCTETINNCTNPLDSLRGGTGALFLSGTTREAINSCT